LPTILALTPARNSGPRRTRRIDHQGVGRQPPASSYASRSLSAVEIRRNARLRLSQVAAQASRDGDRAGGHRASAVSSPRRLAQRTPFRRRRVRRRRLAREPPGRMRGGDGRRRLELLSRDRARRRREAAKARPDERRISPDRTDRAAPAADRRADPRPATRRDDPRRRGRAARGRRHGVKGCVAGHG
jgi:hypothetical protein